MATPLPPPHKDPPVYRSLGPGRLFAQFFLTTLPACTCVRVRVCASACLFALPSYDLPISSLGATSLHFSPPVRDATVAGAENGRTRRAFSFPCPAAAAGPSSVAVSGGKFKLLLVNGTPRKVWGRSLGVGTVRSPSFRDYSGSRGVIFCSCYCCHSAAPDELFAPDNAQPVSSVTCCHTFLNARRNTVYFAG